MKKIIITGGAGFIGSHTCEAFLEKGCSVFVIDNFNDYYDPEIKRKNIIEIETGFGTGNFKVYESDIRDKESIMNIFERHKDAFVIHLAACAGVRPSIENPKLYFDVNVMGTLNILECMNEMNMKQLIFASSSSVYGENSADLFSEGKSDDRPISPYAATKRSCELLCHTFHHIYGFNIACLRFFTVYGPRQREDLAIHKFTKLITDGAPINAFGNGKSMRDYTYIDDIVDGILGAYNWICETHNAFEIFNLGGGQAVTLERLISTLEAELDKKAIINRMPMQAGDVSKTSADISKASQAFGYHPKTDFNTGIKNFVNWYKR